MNGTEQVLTEICRALCASGIAAQEEYRALKMTAPETPVAVAGIEQTTALPLGLGNYLGAAVRDGRAIEYYARKIELRLSLRFYAPRQEGTSGAGTLLERAEEILLTALPAGLRASEFRRGAWRYDNACGAYLCPCSLLCTACFTAATDEESGALLDFKLKGVIQK